jgi:hypothetical protein
MLILQTFPLDGNCDRCHDPSSVYLEKNPSTGDPKIPAAGLHPVQVEKYPGTHRR